MAPMLGVFQFNSDAEHFVLRLFVIHVLYFLHCFELGDPVAVVGGAVHIHDDPRRIDLLKALVGKPGK